MQPPHPAVPRPVDQLVATLDDALGLLTEFSGATDIVPVTGQNPASLLDQCLALCAQKSAARPEPIRTVHHFAATGGSLISKCIAAMPNTQVLSEVDPLSTLRERSEKPRFAPTDMVALMRQSTRGTNPELIIELFLGSLGTVYAESIRWGQRLVLRDHAHSHFCTGAEIPNRPSFRAIVASRFSAVSVVTVRHPLDSFLSLQTNKWLHFSPATFDEYCKRYVAFLDAHEGIPVVRYEDFVKDPQGVMSNICAFLEIPFSDQFTELFSVFRMTGDSGRTGNVIEYRPRRPVSGALAEEWKGSPTYRRLQSILGYDE